MGIQQLSLWLFPESDFDAWKKLVGEAKLTSYADTWNCSPDTKRPTPVVGSKSSALR